MKKFKTKVNVKKNTTCKSCVRLTSEKYGESTCREKGVLASGKVCSGFKADLKDLRSSEGEANVIELLQLIRKLSEDQLTAIASLLSRAAVSKKFMKYKVMQPVFILVSGNGDQLDDYCRGYILDADADHIRVINKEATMIAQFPLDTTSIFTTKKFKAIRPKLKRDKKVTPNKSKVVREVKFEDDEIPTIETAYENKKLKKRNVLTTDIYTLMQPS